MPPTSSKVALITGSGKKRVGWHVAEALARRGYRLGIHYHTSAADAKETVHTMRNLGAQAHGFQADLSDDKAARKLVDQTLQKFGRLDLLVNCAAIYSRKKLEDITADDVRRDLEINTLGTFICSQQAGLAMVDQPEGGLIVMFSDWAIERPYLHYAAYFPSKGAIPAMTRSLAVELGIRNPRVRVNCIVPGPVLFPPDMPKKERDASIQATLVKREGQPQHVAQTVLFLVDNDFVTGVCLPVDGGRTIFSPDSAS